MNIQRMKPAIVLLISTLSLGASTFVQAGSENRFGVGARIQISSWKGNNDNNGSTSDFDASDNQLALSFHYQHKRFYTGLSLQGGSFDFNNGAPDMNYKTSVTPNNKTISSVTIDRGEVDLLAGYYFWSHISLFLDIKSITNSWKDQNYSTKSTGLGLGITGFIPLPKNWTLYGTFGLVPSMDIQTGGEKIGHGASVGLEFGGTYTLDRHNNISIGLKSQGQSYDFDNGHKQTYSLGGLTVGYNFNF